MQITSTVTVSVYFYSRSICSKTDPAVRRKGPQSRRKETGASAEEGGGEEGSATEESPTEKGHSAGSITPEDQR